MRYRRRDGHGSRPRHALLLLAALLLVAGCSSDDVADPDAPPDLPPDPAVARDTLLAEVDATLAALAPLTFTQEAETEQAECALDDGSAGTQWLLAEHVSGAAPAPAQLATDVQRRWEDRGYEVVRSDAPDFYGVQGVSESGSLILDVGVEGQGATLSGETACVPA